MVALAVLAVFLVVLFVSWSLLKVLPLYLNIRKWHDVLDDKIPHDSVHPVWGNLHQILSMKDFSDFALKNFITKGAKSFSYWIGFPRPVVVASHPETVKAILRTTEPKSRGGGGYNFLEPWIGDGLLISSGQKWERNRRLLTPAFHFDILHPYVKVYNKSARGLLKNLENEGKGGNSVEIANPVGLAALDTMLQCTLSYDDDIQEKGSSHPYVQAVTRLGVLFMMRFLNMYHHVDFIYKLSAEGREHRKLTQFVHEFSESIIKKRRENLEQDPDQVKGKRHLDFLDILLTARDETGQGLTDKEIRDEVDTFMFEGHDTTSSAISWCLYCLALYPEEQQKVLQEVLEVIGDKEEVEWEDITKLQYVPLFIKESMRLYPPVPMVSRQLSQPLLLDGVQVPSGVIVDISVFHTHRNPHVWPDCMEFKPSRFDLDSSADRDPYCFVPFAAGPRNCIGQNFALNELKVMLCQTVRRFKIDLDPERKPEILPEVVLRSKNGLYLKFTPRN